MSSLFFGNFYNVDFNETLSEESKKVIVILFAYLRFCVFECNASLIYFNKSLKPLIYASSPVEGVAVTPHRKLKKVNTFLY